MILATTTEDFRPFTDNHKERVRLCAEAGFKHIDLSLYTLIKDDPLFGDNWREATEELLSYAESLGVRFVQCHAPAVNCLAKDGFQRAVQFTERAIEICGVLRIPIMVTHAGYDAAANEDAWREGNLRFYRALMPTAEKNGVRVLAENSAHVNIKGYYLYDGKALRAFADEMNHPNFGVCWDTGHANMEGAQYEEILTLGNALGAIHFNDNRGERDEHLLPFMGTMNVNEVMHALLDIGFAGPFTFEATSAFRPHRFWLGNRREFPEDERMTHATLDMQRAIERTLYETGRAILTSYGLFEG